MKGQKEIAIISFTRTANRLNQRIQEGLSARGYICKGYTTARLKETGNLKALDVDMRTWIGQHWGRKTFLFIGAAGIAVRYIAPWVRDKYTDSAVLVMDERGEYVIPLLSGHMGGAVAAARELENMLHATAVITTATDVQDKFAVDVFARDHDLHISDRHLVTQISARILEEEPVGFYSELAIEGPMPSGLAWCDRMEGLEGFAYGIAVVKEMAAIQELTAVKESLGKNILVLRPRRRHRIVVGIGCRRGTEKRRIESALSGLLKEHGLELQDVVKIASIELKKDEPGLLKLAEEYHLPFYTYSAEELHGITGEMAGSEFVQKVTGVDNVCERSALCCSPKGRLLQPKRIVGGITFALVEEEMSLTLQ